MKTLLALATSLLLASCAFTRPSDTGAAVGTLVDQLQIAIDLIDESEASAALPPLKSATIVISSKVVNTADLGASLVVAGKGVRKNTSSNTVTLVLIPNLAKAEFVQGVAGQRLAESVIQALSGLENAKGLALQSLKVNLALDLVRTASGGIEIELAGVSIGGSSSSERTTGHSLTLLFSA